jgi:hypothetical protein
MSMDVGVQLLSLEWHETTSMKSIRNMLISGEGFIVL